MFKAYTDGGSRGNPGPSAAAGVIFSPESKQLVEVSKFLGTQTNNYAEYTGLIITLEKCISLKIKNLEVFMDSKLIVEQMNGKWKVKKLQVLFNTAKELVTHFESITFTHLRRELNKHADSLVNQCLDSQPDSLSDKLVNCVLS